MPCRKPVAYCAPRIDFTTGNGVAPMETSPRRKLCLKLSSLGILVAKLAFGISVVGSLRKTLCSNVFESLR